MQKKIEQKIAAQMDAQDRRSRYKKDDIDDAEEREKDSMNKDLLVKKLEKQIKTLKTLNDNQKTKLTQQLDLSQNANIVMKKQCLVLKRQIEDQAKQSDAIIDKQKSEIKKLLDSNLNRGI